MLQAPLTPSAFPPDAVAVIYRPARSVMTSGLANTRRWKLRFERHSAPFIESLMGWSGGDDILSQVELTFPSIEAAIAYARRQGFEFVVHGLEEAEMTRHRLGSTPKRRDPNRMIARSRRLEWVESARLEQMRFAMRPASIARSSILRPALRQSERRVARSETIDGTEA
jgi:hypothetical protein